MSKHHFLWLSAFCLAALLWSADPVQAQRGVRVGAGVGRPISPAVRPVYGAGRVAPGAWGGYGYRYGYGYGYGAGYYRWPYYGTYFRGTGIGVGVGWAGGVYGAYAGYNPYVIPVYRYIAVRGDYAEPSSSTSASIRVLLPDPQAKVWFDGHATTSTGRDRVFYSPPLTADSGTSYRIRAAWLVQGKEMIQEQVVEVRPGYVSVVDFTRPVQDEGPEPTPAK